jgi:hypothetical protein
MSGVVLVLGPVAFKDFEIPAGINFRGRQLLAVHQLTGGRRIVDSIGASETEIMFSGSFSGADATLRARVLNSLRVAGGVLTLTWDVFFYTVILTRFDANYQNPVWIPYRISCTVIRDEAAAAILPAISLSNSVLADLGLAAGQCANLGINLTDAQDSLADPDATTVGSAGYVAAQSSINLAQTAIDTQIRIIESAFQTAIAADTGSAGPLITNLIVSTTAAGQLADLTSAGAYVGRAARNLSNAST